MLRIPSLMGWDSTRTSFLANAASSLAGVADLEVSAAFSVEVTAAVCVVDVGSVVVGAVVVSGAATAGSAVGLTATGVSADMTDDKGI